MAAATADLNTLVRTRTKEISIPLADNVKIYSGTLVCINSAGYAVPGADAAGNVVIGVADETQDNTVVGHTLGAISVRVRCGVNRFAKSGAFLQGSIGRKCYATDDSHVQTADPGSSTVAGLAIEVDVEDSSFIWVEVEPATVAGTGGALLPGSQALAGAGAVDVTHRTTKYTSTGAAQALTLANGAFLGQRKTINHVVDGGSGVLTPANLQIGTTITFTAVNDWVELEWNGTKWDVVAFGGATFA